MKILLLLFLSLPAHSQIGAINTFPGGTSGQIQYNNGGRFGGVPGISSTVLVGLGASTGTLRSDFSAFISTAGPLISTLGQSTATLSASTASVYAALQSTGSALTIETARATAAEDLRVLKAGDTMTGRLTAPDATLTYGLTAATGSFSGSVTVGSMTSLGDVRAAGVYNVGAVQAVAITGGNFVVGNPAGGGTQNVWIAANGDYRAKFQGDGGVAIPGSVTVSSMTVEASGGASLAVGRTGFATRATLESDGTHGYLSTAGGAGALIYRINNVEKVRVHTDGNFGVGTNAPVATVHADAAGGGTIRATRLGTGSGYIQIETDGTDGAVASTNKLHLNTNGAQRAAIDENGNFGIGSGATKSTFTATGFWEPISKTKAQIDLLVPTKVGQVIYASDTTLPGLCISTGTSAAQWRKMESATLGCGTNN